MTVIRYLAAAASLTILAAPLWADGHSTPIANADVAGVGGEIAGNVTLSQMASGVVLAQIDLTGVPEGEHAVHLHAVGDCSADDFSSAGGHVAGDHDHGIGAADGPHPGDMPNMTVQADGILKADVFLTSLNPETMILDADGAAFVMHDGVDDYISQPSGDAGSRIACGVFN